VVLDQRRVEVERQLLALEQRADAGEEAVEDAVELSDVTEVEARQQASERRRVGDAVAARSFARASPARRSAASLRQSPPAISVSQKATIACPDL
jgi:hypothetical protein